MRIYSVTDGYINYLQSEHPHVYSNKEAKRGVPSPSTVAGYTSKFKKDLKLRDSPAF